MLKLNIRKSELVYLTAVSSNNEGVRACGNTADHVGARNLWLLPLFGIIDLVWVGDLFDMESIFFTALFLLFLFKSCQLGVLRAILPVVYYVVTCDDHVCLVHCNVLRLNGDILVFNGASNSITKDNDPLVWCLLSLCDEDTIFTASHDLLKTAHVLHMLLIDGGVPKDNTHVLALGLFERENQSVVEVRPQILWLNVGEKDV